MGSQWNYLRKHRYVAALSLILIAGTVACRPTINLPPVPVNDAGDASFVRQVVPVLLGRKVRGYDELKLLTDLIQATSRETVVR